MSVLVHGASAQLTPTTQQGIPSPLALWSVILSSFARLKGRSICFLSAGVGAGAS